MAAWRSVQGAADHNGFEFFTPSRPDLAPLNPKNDGVPFSEIFQAFKHGQKEYFFHDRHPDKLVVARPVRLQASCLIFHGDPATSRTGDGKDPLGFPMENAKEGDIKGAFVLRANVGHDPVILATMKAMAAGSFIGLVGVLLAFRLFNGRWVIRPLIAAIKHLEMASTGLMGATGEISRTSQTLAEGGQRADRFLG